MPGPRNVPRRGPDLLPGTLDLMILKVLARRPEHGYGIARLIKERSDDVLRVEEGSLYPALHRLAKKGLLTAHWEQSETNRRAKYYDLTERGRAVLSEEQQRWKRMSTAVNRVIGVRPA